MSYLENTRTDMFHIPWYPVCFPVVLKCHHIYGVSQNSVYLVENVNKSVISISADKTYKVIFPPCRGLRIRHRHHSMIIHEYGFWLLYNPILFCLGLPVLKFVSLAKMQTHLDLHCDLSESQAKIFLPQKSEKTLSCPTSVPVPTYVGCSPFIQDLSITSFPRLIQ